MLILWTQSGFHIKHKLTQKRKERKNQQHRGELNVNMKASGIWCYILNTAIKLMSSSRSSNKVVNIKLFGWKNFGSFSPCLSNNFTVFSNTNIIFFQECVLTWLLYEWNETFKCNVTLGVEPSSSRRIQHTVQSSCLPTRKICILNYKLLLLFFLFFFISQWKKASEAQVERAEKFYVRFINANKTFLQHNFPFFMFASLLWGIYTLIHRIQVRKLLVMSSLKLCSLGQI